VVAVLAARPSCLPLAACCALARAPYAAGVGATPHRDALLESYDRYVERYGLAPKG